MELLEIALLMLVAKILEEVMVRRGALPLLGWTLAGIFLGPAVLSIVTLSSELIFLTNIGVYLLFFMVGLDEVSAKDMASSLNLKHIMAQVISTVAVVLSTYLIGLNIGLSVLESISLSILISLPTTSVVVKSLSDTNSLKTDAGTATFYYVFIGEVIGLFMASTLLELGNLKQVTLGYIALQISRVFLYFIFMWLVNAFLVTRLVKIMRLHISSEGTQIGVVLALMFIFVSLSEVLGLHGVMGAFILGLFLSNTLIKDFSGRSLQALRRVGDGVLIPLFFASIGLRFGWDFIYQDLLMLLTLALLLIPYRMITHYLVLKTLKAQHTKEISVSMLARGGVDLVILVTLFQRDFIGSAIHSLTIIMSILSLFIYPLIIRKSFRKVDTSALT